eukprot:559158-Lingulodinium_polyedra.AAC.1
MAADNRIDGEVRDEDAAYQARWAYYEIFGIDPYRYSAPDRKVPEDRMVFRPDVLLRGRSKGHKRA